MLSASLLGFCSNNVCVLNDARFQDGPKEIWPADILSSVVEDYIRTRMHILPSKTASDDDSAYQDSTPTKVVQIITFDSHGVSGHRNHVDTYAGVRYLVTTTTPARLGKRASDGGNSINVNVRMQAWELKTVGILRKYCIILDFVIVKVWPITYIWMFIMFLLGYSNLAAKYFSSKGSNNNAAVKDHPGKELVLMGFDPLTVWKAMAAHYSQFVWYRRLSVLFSRYTYCNVLKEIR